MSFHLSDEALSHLVQRAAPGGQFLRTWPLAGGISAQMTALEIEDAGGRKRKMILRQPGEEALRRDPQAAAREYRLLQLLRAHGLPTPAPLYFDPSGQIFPGPCLLIEYVDGDMNFQTRDQEGYAVQMADALARIHGVGSAELAFLPEQSKGLDALLGPRPASLHPVLDEAKIRGALEEAWPFPQRNPPALLHGDFWPGNILWRDGRLAAVIDWEDACVGDPLSDLTISRLDLLCIFGRKAMDAFTRRYRSRMKLDFSCLAFWDLSAALRLIRLAGSDLDGWAAFFIPYGRSDITAQTIRDHLAWFTHQAFERLAIP